MKKRVKILSQFKSLFPFLRRYGWWYVLGMFFDMLVDAGLIFIPQLTRRAIDIISSGVFQWQDIASLAVWMVVIAALISGGRFLWRYFIHGSSRRIVTELRQNIFDHLSKLSWDYYQKNKIGDLMARSINDLNAVRMAISMGMIAFFDFIFMASSILIIIFIQDARSALLAIIPLPFISALIIVFGKMVGGKFKRAQEAYSSMSDTVQETFAGIRVVKSFVKEWWFIKKFERTNDDYRKTNMELVRLFGFFFPFITFLSHLTVLIMLLIGGRRVILGIMSPGSLVAMFQYLAMLIWPLMGAGFTVNMIQRGAVSLGRVNEILNTKPSIQDPENPQTAQAEDTVPAIEMENLTFSYNAGKDEKQEAAAAKMAEGKKINEDVKQLEGEKQPDSEKQQEGEKESEEPSPVLENVNLKVKRGEWLGIMGRTGSGKSTLIKTLTRIIDPPDGTVRVFGLDVRKWPLEDLRKLFAVSPQDSYLFSDSIQNNIAYGLAEGDDEKKAALLNRAIEAASLEKDLASFADGRNTTVGERGLTLSGGQKQRAAIGRALVMESEFLILDDSLSAVDNETERGILEALIRERKGKTTIIISHRVSTLKYADKVLVLDKGKVLEYGSPGELVTSGGFYSRMAALQRLDEGPDQGTGAVNG